MNLYICSTVRHLLFSVLRASYNKQPSHILFFYDYQDVDPASLQPNALPSNITVSLIRRHSVQKRLQSSLIGKIFNFLAMRNAYIPEGIRTAFRHYLYQHFPEITSHWESSASLHLFVFNERNKMSRLFRLLVPDYAMIEDGMANYYRIKCSKSKWPVRLLLGKSPTHKVFGESRRCKTIYVITPEKTPEEIRAKAKHINFLDTCEDLPAINRFFGIDPMQTLQADSTSSLSILATQPMFNPECNDDFFFTIYNKVIAQLNKQGEAVILKCHPTEDPHSYQQHFAPIRIAPAKLPLELLLLNTPHKPKVISIASSAGLGLEKYCHLIRLIEDHELTENKKIMQNWVNNPLQLEQLIRSKLTCQTQPAQKNLLGK